MVASVPPTLISMGFGAIGLAMVIYASSQPDWAITHEPVYVSLGLFQFCIEDDCSSCAYGVRVLPHGQRDCVLSAAWLAVDQPSACGSDEYGRVTLCKQWFMVNGARAFAVITVLLASAAISITLLFLFGKSEKRSQRAGMIAYFSACACHSGRPRPQRLQSFGCADMCGVYDCRWDRRAVPGSVWRFQRESKPRLRTRRRVCGESPLQDESLCSLNTVTMCCR